MGICLFAQTQYESVLCIIAPVSKCGFINQASVWNVLIERAMPGLCMSPENFQEFRLNFEASKSPLEKWPYTLLGHMAYGSLCM